METQYREFTAAMDALPFQSHENLDPPDPPDPLTRVRAIYNLTSSVSRLEHQVVFDAKTSGLIGARIGKTYGVSRQAAHQRFSDEAVVPSDFFDQLLDDLDEDVEVAPALTGAAERSADR